MAKTTTTTVATSSLDRSKEFQKCCATAMGFEWVDQFDPDEVVGESANNSLNQGNGGMFDGNNNSTIHDGFDGTHGTQGIHQIINLLADDDEDRYDHDDDDGSGDEDRASNSYDETKLWMENAKRISQDLTKMSVWIQSKALKYVGLDMQDDEASLIQSTITTFAASTASELETLREMNNNLQNKQNNMNMNLNLINHRAGIVQILLMKLQDEITTPFSKLQKQRTRIAVKIWQHPLQCRLYHHHRQHKKNKRNQFGTGGTAGGNTGITSNTSPSRSRMEELLFDDDDEYDGDGYNHRDQKFYPKHQGHGEGTNSINFIQKYAQRRQQQQDQEGNQSVEPQPPEFVKRLTKRQRVLQQQQQQQQQQNSAKMKKYYDHADADDHSDSDGFNFGGQNDNDQMTGTATKEAFQQPNTVQSPQTQQQQQQHQEPLALPYQEQLATDLEEETMQLATEMIATSDLDSVQKMEQKMVQITTLIGQFSNLVQEQQEQIVSVHESAIETKENIEKGQENLVDATERTKRSKHYKALVIFAMGFILLFFHILRN